MFLRFGDVIFQKKRVLLNVSDGTFDDFSLESNNRNRDINYVAISCYGVAGGTIKQDSYLISVIHFITLKNQYTLVSKHK